jgi:transcriptional regulator with XRE-family HTH domain
MHPDNIKRIVASNLKSLRTAKNYTQEYVAEKLGKNDYTAYQRLESGNIDLKFDVAYRIAELYNIPMERLYVEDEHPLVRDVDPKSNYIRKTQIEVNVKLDGSDLSLEHQIELLRKVNNLIKG